MRTFVALLFVALAVPALAKEPPPPPGEGRFCDEHPRKCEELRARHADWCKKNPVTCEAQKTRREARRQACEKDPQRCEELRAERRQRREERRDDRRDWCEANPEECAEHLEDRAERREQRRDNVRPGGPPR